jgi:hypothetical protein
VTTREFTQAELEELDPDEVASAPWRHGRMVTYVAEVDGQHWRFAVRVHHEEGWQDEDPITATLVRQVEKIVKVWEAIP